jgi:hypothetical protein
VNSSIFDTIAGDKKCLVVDLTVHLYIPIEPDLGRPGRRSLLL